MNYLKDFNVGTGLKGYLATVLGLNRNSFDIISSAPIYAQSKYIDSYFSHLIGLKQKNFWLFGCPSSKSKIRADVSKLCKTLNDTTEVCNFDAKNYHLIYASSEGMDDMNEIDKTQLLYNQYKAVLTHYISTTIPSATILKIPRVYGPNKKAGVFEKIRNAKDVDLLIRCNQDLVISYINEEMFKSWVESEYKNAGIITYKKRKKNIKFKKLVDLIIDNRLDKL